MRILPQVRTMEQKLEGNTASKVQLASPRQRKGKATRLSIPQRISHGHEDDDIHPELRDSTEESEYTPGEEHQDEGVPPKAPYPLLSHSLPSLIKF